MGTVSFQLNESATRAALIDKQLKQRGWHADGVDFEVEYEVGSAGDADHGFSDYWLPGKDGTALAIVEAKRTSRDPLAGKEQARRYAESIEAASGARPLIFLANGYEIWYWDRVGNPRPVGSFFSQEEIERKVFQLQHGLPPSSLEIDSTIVARPYSHEAIRRTHDAFEEGQRRGLWVMATGTGKTRTAVALVDTLMRARMAERVLFLVDRIALATQARDAFQEFLPATPVGLLKSSTFDGSKRVYIATLQTMQDFHQEFSSGAFDLIFSDECHRSIYNKWESVLTYFDARLVGLTATPADFIDRNTFTFFGCPTRVPTFAYSMEQAVDEGYLVPYEVYRARTRIQMEGIKGAELPPEKQQELIDEGIDPEDIDFEGTELERRVTNKETTRLVVREFFEQCIKSPDSNLPGKSILFALSHAHAHRLWEVFAEEFPQFPDLARIIDSHMEDPATSLDEFRLDDMPRVAISVDMLDTGVDIPSVVNLGFMKPVFSKIKFWQMIGRGTRTVDEDNEKPWCPAGSKSKFRILDFWDNFAYFQLNPDGVEPTTSVPVAVRLFRLVIRTLRQAEVAGEKELQTRLRSKAAQMIAQLPLESAGVREYRSLVETIQKEAFWTKLSPKKFDLLNLEAAPLMRFLASVDLDASTLEARCLEFILLRLEGKDNSSLAGDIVASLGQLPRTHPGVSSRISDLDKVTSEGWLASAANQEILDAVALFATLMKYRLRDPSHIITLDLEDAFQHQEWVQVGPDAKAFEMGTYRAEVEKVVRTLAQEHPAMQKLANGKPLSEADIAAIEDALNQPELFIDEESLKKAYRVPSGSLVALLRHALDIEHLPDRDDLIREAFETYVTEKAYLQANQLSFIRLFAVRLIKAGTISEGDLYSEPFTRLGDPTTYITDDELKELFDLAAKFEVVTDA